MIGFFGNPSSVNPPDGTSRLDAENVCEPRWWRNSRQTSCQRTGLFAVPDATSEDRSFSVQVRDRLILGVGASGWRRFLSCAEVIGPGSHDTTRQ